VVFDGPPLELWRDPALLEQVGQEQPPLVRLLAAARAQGAQVPEALTWRAINAIQAPEPVA
jgi:hypothetical protein